MVFQLTDEIAFPDPRLGEPDGVLAIGGELNEDWLLLAYNYGIFPWFSFRDWPCPAWYCPMQRFVIFTDAVHISHSMRTLMNKGEYRVTFNRDFEGVIKGCSEVNGRYYSDGAWLGEQVMEAYTDMHLLGYAMSMPNAFIGESMFSREPNTSKLALICLAQRLQSIGIKMIDCQLETAHLKSMGGRFISYEEYMKILNPKGLKAITDAPSTDDA